MVMSPLVHESSPGFTLVQAIVDSPLSATINGKIMTGFWHGKELSDDIYMMSVRSNEVGHCEGARIL